MSILRDPSYSFATWILEIFQNFWSHLVRFFLRLFEIFWRSLGLAWDSLKYSRFSISWGSWQLYFYILIKYLDYIKFETTRAYAKCWPQHHHWNSTQHLAPLRFAYAIVNGQHLQTDRYSWSVEMLKQMRTTSFRVTFRLDLPSVGRLIQRHSLTPWYPLFFSYFFSIILRYHSIWHGSWLLPDYQLSCTWISRSKI